MISFLEEGFSVKLGEFGSFRPSIQAKSQDSEEEVDADTVSRVKIIFAPGSKFQQMLNNVSVESFTSSPSDGGRNEEESGGSDSGSEEESPDPIL